MSLRSRLIGPCGHFTENPDRMDVDIGTLVRRLLLFDTYILQSTRLFEAPTLVATFGFSGLKMLLESGALRIHCEARSVAQTGQAAILEKRQRKGVLPLCSYNLQIVSMTDREEYVSRCLQNVQRSVGISLKQEIKLKRAFIDAMVTTPENFGIEALRAVPQDIQNVDLMREVVIRAAREMTGTEIPRERVVVRAHQIDDEDFRVESNLQDLGKYGELETHKILERAVLAVGGLNFRIEEMRTHNALSGVLGEDLPILMRKLDFITRELAPQNQERQFGRVVELAGFPDVVPGTKLDVEKLLKVRDSRECREFRQWLQGIDSATDNELLQHLTGLKAKTDQLVQSRLGKSIRFLATTGLGVIPGLGTALGTIAGGLDMFVVDKLFTEAGPAAFVNRLYPSIFLDPSGS